MIARSFLHNFWLFISVSDSSHGPLKGRIPSGTFYYWTFGRMAAIFIQNVSWPPGICDMYLIDLTNSQSHGVGWENKSFGEC